MIERNTQTNTMLYLQWALIISTLASALFVVLFLYGKDNDDYYHPWLSLNCKHIPLIKPYSVGNCGGEEWIMDYSGAFGDKIVALNVFDSIIIAVNFDEFVPENSRDTTWFVYIPHKGIRYAFKNKNSFDTAILQVSKKPIKTIPCKELFAEFIEKGYLEWFPVPLKRKFHFWRII